MHSLFFFAIVKLSLPEKFTTENIIKTRRKTSALHYPHIHNCRRFYIFVLYFIHKYKEALTFQQSSHND